MKQEQGPFESDDIDILAHAVSIYPNLEYACFATKLAIKHLKFPINTREDFKPLFSVGDLPKNIAKRGIGEPHLRKFLPDEFFPIADERDFLGKVLAALTWGETIHHHERFLKDPRAVAPLHYRKEK